MAQLIKLCSYCQKEFPEVDKAVKAADKSKIGFTHGVCPRHFRKFFEKSGTSPEQIEKYIGAMKDSIPDLREHPELIKQYSQGIFTPDQYKQTNQIQQTESEMEFEPTLKEAFQKRAGIIIS